MSETIINKTLGQILADTVARSPDSPAVVYVDRDYRQTWREFEADVDAVAKGLMAMGVQKGEKVAVWATNVPHWVTLQFATAKIGAVLMTINTNYKVAELGFVLEQSDCENLVLIDGLRDVNYLDIVYELVPELRTHPRGMLRSKKFPSLRRVVFLGPEKHRGIYSMNEVYAMAAATTGADYAERQSQLAPGDVVNMQYTSGTTGFPKGVQLTHLNIGTNGWWLGRNQNLSPADRVCIPVPLFHCFGCVL
ncbi:MAG: AMP-binding protein, partial [Kiritimatiellaeota bacterium]|nr:AMP-binding protein [Kiritimatiellota bacterium]